MQQLILPPSDGAHGWPALAMEDKIGVVLGQILASGTRKNWPSRVYMYGLGWPIKSLQLNLALLVIISPSVILVTCRLKVPPYLEIAVQSSPPPPIPIHADPRRLEVCPS